MKKALAVILTLIMAFSMAVIPASASYQEDIKADTDAAYGAIVDVYEDLQQKDFEGAVFGTIDAVRKAVNALHTLIHTFSDVFDFDCPFCGDTAEDKVVVDTEKVELA